MPKLKIIVEKGTLSKFGYITTLKSSKRREALTRAIYERQYSKDISIHDAALSIFRKLNVLAMYNKNNNPKRYKIFKSDQKWVKKHFFLTPF